MLSIEIVGVFLGRTSGFSFLSRETIYPTRYPTRDRNKRQRQIESAVRLASTQPPRLIPTSSFDQDP